MSFLFVRPTVAVFWVFILCLVANYDDDDDFRLMFILSFIVFYIILLRSAPLSNIVSVAIEMSYCDICIAICVVICFWNRLKTYLFSQSFPS